MKKYLIPLLLLVSTAHSFCQTPISPEFDKLWEDYKFVKFVDGDHLTQEQNYKGTPYVEVDEKACTLFLQNEQIIENLTIRYNIYKDQMELMRKGIYYVIPRQKEFAAFQLAEHYFKYSTFSENNQILTGNLEVLSEGKCTLYKQFRIFLKPAQPAKPYQDPKPAEFKMNPPNYFIGVQEKIPMKIKNDKDFIKLLPHHQDEISLYIKKNKLKFRKQEDLVKVVEYYNSL